MGTPGRPGSIPRLTPAQPVIPQRREQRSQRHGVCSTTERNPRLWDVHRKQIKRTLCQRTICVGDEGEYGARLTPLGEPVMTTMGKITIVGELNAGRVLPP